MPKPMTKPMTKHQLRHWFVRELHPQAVCEKKPGTACLYQVKQQPGGKIIAGAYSAVQAWKNAVRKLLNQS